MKENRLEILICMLVFAFCMFGFVLSAGAAPGTITTVIGGGVGDGRTATEASLRNPTDVFVDGSGNLYIAQEGRHRVRKVDAATGIITTVAGNGIEGSSGDGGPATEASLSRPSGVFVDGSGNLYIADRRNDRIRKVDAATGIITTVAGDGFKDERGRGRFFGDGGPATEASLSPSDVFVDGLDNLYIADRENHQVRTVDAATGIITTVAGNGEDGFSGDGGPATEASLDLPYGIFMDGSGNLYIADGLNHRIRKVDPSGTITTVAGNGERGFSGGGGPATSASLASPQDVFVDGAGNLYIADTSNHRIRKVDAATGIITTVAGGGVSDGRAATDASLWSPSGIFVDGSGNLYIADTSNHRIRKVDAATGIITTVAGNGERGYSGNGGPATEASLSPSDVFADGLDNLYIVDRGNHRIRKVDAATGIITTVAGNGERSFSGDGGPATDASLWSPSGIFVDGSGNLYIADRRNNRIRKVDAATGIITTVAGNGEGGDSGDYGPATRASLRSPTDVFVDSAGNLYIADGGGGTGRIRRVDPSGIIATVAGGSSLGDGGPATHASLISPTAVFVDGEGNLYIANRFTNRIRKVDAATGIITTVAGNGERGYSGDGGPPTDASLNSPRGVCVDGSGNLYIADSSNDRIRRVEGIAAPTTLVVGVFTSPAETMPPTVKVSWPADGARDIDPDVINRDGMVITFSKVIDTARIHISVKAGGKTLTWQPTWTDGEARLTLKPDKDNELVFDMEYKVILSRVADKAGNAVEEIIIAFTTRADTPSAPPGTITTVAGEGSATDASLSPSDVFVDGSGNLYIVDGVKHRIRKVDPSGIIITVAGNGEGGYSGDGGPATDASLNSPRRIFVDGSGNLYIADAINHRIRKVDAATGIITTVAGNGEGGYSGDGGPATDASLDLPFGIFVDGEGNLYIADSGNHRIRKVDASDIITTVAGNGERGYSGDGGPATDGSLNSPSGVFVDGEGNLYIADAGHHRIRKVDAATGIITTVAGNGERGYSGDGGPATGTSLNNPRQIFVDGSGNLYIADASNHRIRKVDASDIITTVAGNGRSMFLGDGGLATDASLSSPFGVFVDGSGNLYIADRRNGRIRRVEDIAAPTTIIGGVMAKTPDFNGDGTVNFPDFIQFAQNFGKKQGDPDFNAKYDLDDSGSVDFGDFIQFAQSFGKSVGSGKPVRSALLRK